jgi:hypothetical protein
MDTPTANAFAALRSAAVAMVGSVKNKGVSGDELNASYMGTGPSGGRSNTVMIVKNRAEVAAWTGLDPTSRSLIKSFLATP